jgi:hypothetical protein
MKFREEAPGVDMEVEQPLAHLISHMVSGVYAQIAIKIHGDDLDTLQQLSEQVKTDTSVRARSDAANRGTHSTDGGIAYSPADLMILRFMDLQGLTWLRFVQTALQGEVVSQVLEGQRRFDLHGATGRKLSDGLRESSDDCESTCQTTADKSNCVSWLNIGEGSRTQRDQSRKRSPPHRDSLQHSGSRPGQCGGRDSAASSTGKVVHAGRLLCRIRRSV